MSPFRCAIVCPSNSEAEWRANLSRGGAIFRDEDPPAWPQHVLADDVRYSLRALDAEAPLPTYWHTPCRKY
ncbi:hypothetical protein OHA28_09525 [Streptomyces sp. NBC_00269]|uniref:hypothetical protein n=1 Tax=Streptomyces sp. NBC_00269 TaxID=2975696 RepID=UPI002E2B080E|nr:hypothetical protein [Streptomyces sp. NBC_00269]